MGVEGDRVRLIRSSRASSRWGERLRPSPPVAFLAAALLAAPAGAQQSVVVAPSGATTWHDSVRREAAEALTPVPPRAVPITPFPRGGEIGTPGRTPKAPSVGPPGSLPEASGPSITGSFPALGDNNSAIPPDTMGAAGPSHLMTMLNTQLRIQNKTGGNLSTVSLATFWTSGTGLSGDPFDPHVVYDAIAGRWIATVDADGNSFTSKVWFAISATNDPTGAWTFYQFVADDSATTWADYPGLGVNGAWIAITNNMFDIGGLAFAGAKMWVIDKATALSGGPLVATVFATSFDAEGGFGTYGAGLKPALTYSAAEPTLFIVDNSGFTSGGTPLVRLSRITGTGPAAGWSVVPGSTFAGTGLFPVANAFDYEEVGGAQAGTAVRVDAGDTRASDAVYRNGRLWFTHSGTLPIGAPTRNAVFWYQLNPAAMPAPIVQSGVLDGGAGVHHFFPSIAANALDDALVGFSRSHAGIFVQAVTASRFAADAPGTMSAPAVLKSGEDSYVKDFGSGRIRWGDYSATGVDPGDDRSFWTIQEYAALDVGPTSVDDRWGTWWGTALVGAPTSTTTTPTTTTTSTTSIAAVGHLECFKVTDSRTSATYRLDLLAGVAGFANELGCTVRARAKRLCVEVGKQNVNPPPPGGGPVSPPSAGSVFLAYKLTCPKLPLAPVALTDQFGPGTVTVGSATELLVPAAPGPANDRFKCYTARDVRPRQGYAMDLAAGVAGFVDQFGCTVRLGAKRICVQVTPQNVTPTPPGGGPGPGPSSGAKFVSYKLRCPTPALGPAGFGDQFGAGTFTPRTAAALLVPAS